MFRYEEITVLLTDGYQAYGRFWGTSRCRGSVLYHHGIQSHCGWFEASAEQLAEAGYAVLQVDRRGCGRNQQARGDADSAEQLIADAATARDTLARHSGRSDYHVVGVSWGGKLAVAAYVAESTGVRSLNLVTPGLFPQVGVSRETMATIGFAMLYEPDTSFDIPLNAPELFTSDAQWSSYIRNDPRTLQQCTARFFLASRRMDKIIAKLSQAKPVPLHLVLVGDERIIDNDKTKGFIGGLGWPDAHVTVYDQARHSVEFEKERQAYFADLVAFIDKA